MIEMLWSEKNP